MYKGKLDYENRPEEKLRVLRLEPLEDLMVFDLFNESGAATHGGSGATGRLLGVAEKQENGDYVSPWIYMMDRAGNWLDVSARIVFKVVGLAEQGATHCQIVGIWEDANFTPHKFVGILQSRR